jgi:small basic protein (TIGR04137 family)
LRSYLWFVSANRQKDAPYRTAALDGRQSKRDRSKTLFLKDLSLTPMPLREIWRKSLLSPKLNKHTQVILMSRHNSYGKSSKTAKTRNVLKRFERIDVLRRLGKWKDGENTKATGLPKTPVSS